VDELRDQPQPEVGIHAYRIVQEALANVRRHAEARKVRVELRSAGGELEIVVADDGRGFDPAAEVPDGHLGLSSIRQRADLLGGGSEIESAPGAGTTVRVRVPLRRVGRR